MSDSDSSQQQTSNYTDSRTVLGEGSNNAQNGSTIFSTTTSNVLDAGAIGSAFTFGNNALDANTSAVGGALTFGTRTLNSALDFAGDALAGALSSNNTTTRQALDFGNSALASNADTTRQAFTYGRQTLDLADSAFGRALDYSTRSTSAALDNLQNTQTLTAAAYNDAKGRGALTDKIIIGAIGAMALVAFFALRGKA